MKIHFPKKAGGFTLIELMTAMSITSILVVIIVGLTSVGVNFLKTVREDVRSAANSRPALWTLSTDLESMHMRSGNSFEWLYAAKDPGITESNMKLGPQKARAANAAQLLFFSSAADRTSAVDSFGQKLDRSARDSAGDVNLISYRLVYRDHILDEDASDQSLGFPVFALYRNVVPADLTYNGGQGGPALLGQKNLQSAYSSRERFESEPTNFLAENIVEFTVAFEVEYESRPGSSANSNSQGSNTSTVLIPILASSKTSNVGECNEFRVRGNNIYVNGSAGSTPGISAGRVVGIIVSMTVITDEGMGYVDQMRKTKGGSSMPAERFFEKFSRNYTQRIPVVRT